MHPLCRSIGPVLLLPDWHHFLERVDQPLAGLERRLPMRRADCDRHAGFSQIDSPQPINPSSVVIRTKIQRGGTRKVFISAILVIG